MALRLLPSGKSLALALAFGCLLQAGDGLCQSSEDRVGARSAASEGAKAFSEQRWADAIDFFKRAESLVHAPPHLLYIARAQVETGKLVEAREHYLSIVHEELKADAPQVFRAAKESAATELKAVEARLPYATITLKGSAPSDLLLTLDGAKIPAALVGIPRPVDPGAHKVEARGTGVTGSASFQIKEAERQKVIVELVASKAGAAPLPAPTPGPEPAPVLAPVPAPSEGETAPPPPTEDTGGGSSRNKGLFIGSMVGFGVGAVGLALGTVFVLKAGSKQSDADKLYEDNNCSAPGSCPQQAEILDLDDQAKSARIIGIAGFALGGVGLATGVTLLVLSNKQKSEAAALAPTVNVGVGPGSFLVKGTF